MKRLAEKYKNFKRLFGFDNHAREFRNNLRKNPKKEFRKNKKILLIEGQQPISNLIGLKYFIPAYLSLFGGRAISYNMMSIYKFTWIKEFIRFRFSILRAIGCQKNIIVPYSVNNTPEELHTKILEQFHSVQKLTPEDFEDLVIDGVHLGDLIYDKYLRTGASATLNITDPIFKQTFFESLNYFYSWVDFFNHNEISGICVSHCAYNFAIPLRLAIYRDIPAFQVTAESVHRITTDFPYAYTESRNYKKELETISPREISTGLEKARQRLELRFKGEVGVDMPYSTKSAFNLNNYNSGDLIEKTPRIKIFVAVHDFFDSPHGYGKSFYPDFLIWLEALGKISRKTDYDWYIKTHPDLHPGMSEKVVKDFVMKFTKFRLLPKESSHLKIIEGGIDVVLTVFGTVAMEYSYLGIPVINASKNNPHVAFKFSYTPLDRINYEKTIENLSNFLKNFRINRDEVLEYYFMAHIYKLKSWTKIDYDTYIREVGGYKESMTSKSLKYFNESQNVYDDVALEDAIFRFLLSSDICLGRKHFNLTE